MSRAALLAAGFLVAATTLNAQAAPDSDSSPTAALGRDSRPLQAFASSARAGMLVAHGVDPEPSRLVAFLEKGFREEMVLRGLPTVPETKAQVVDAAIKELGVQRSRAGVDVLSRLARGEMPRGVESVVSRDLERQPLAMREQALTACRMVFKSNAVVALGLIGDESALPAVRDAMATSTDPATRIECAVAMALLGSGEGLPALVELAGSEEARISGGAFDAVFYATGRNHGVWRETSEERRREAAAELAKWYRGQGVILAVNPADVLRRRMEGPPRPVAPEGSLRALLRATRNPMSQSGRMEARERLAEIGPSNRAELRALALDPAEDNDIRAEAARWYSMLEPKASRSILKKLLKDENEPVAQTAKTLLARLDREKK